MTKRNDVLLKIENLTKNFGGLTAINHFSMDVFQGEISGLIGPNGAGKSTVLNMISGSMLPTSGSISLYGKRLTGFPPHRISKEGIARVFQGNILFHHLSVNQNVLIGSHLRTNLGFFSSIIGSSYSRNLDKTMQNKTSEILDLVGLKDRENELAVNLSHGNQRLLCLAVALASNPKLLLLDEPVTGMNAQEVSEMVSLLKMLQDKKGITSIVVEHNMKAVMSLCDRITVINHGAKIAEGSPSEISQNPLVIEAYLGKEMDVTYN